jgi:hypothetical protein
MEWGAATGADGFPVKERGKPVAACELSERILLNLRLLEEMIGSFTCT